MGMSKRIVRLCTAGSVDDGKSTLIGRILLDSQLLSQNVTQDISHETDTLNLAHVTDGLKEERALGITIDVAYRYFTTPKTKYILADSPGHYEYTRNMVTAASLSNVLILIIDVNNGVVEQTRRHTYIASILGIKEIIVCINKMDQVDYSAESFYKVKNEHQSICDKLGFGRLNYIPTSALHGDNVVHTSDNMTWYEGSSIIETLDNLEFYKKGTRQELRITVHGTRQHGSDVIHYGQLLSGEVSEGQEVWAYPMGESFMIQSIYKNGSKVQTIDHPSAISFKLNESSRRITLLTEETGSHILNKPRIKATICWMDDVAMSTDQYLLKHQTGFYNARIIDICNKININTFQEIETSETFKMNEIGVIEMELSENLAHDLYANQSELGNFILIDKQSKQTVAAGMI